MTLSDTVYRSSQAKLCRALSDCRTFGLSDAADCRTGAQCGPSGPCGPCASVCVRVVRVVRVGPCGSVLVRVVRVGPCGSVCVRPCGPCGLFPVCAGCARPSEAV